MWFRMPEGCGGISVERQEFFPEIRDEKGFGYFRAPNHFAPRILMNKGFVAVERPPEGAPEDLPNADPLRDGAISDLTKTVDALKLEAGGLRSDLNVAVAKVAALVADRDGLLAKVEELTNKITDLEEELEERPMPEVKKK